jgi:hypothetical protein
VSTDQVRSGLAEAGVPADEADAIADSYSAAQLVGLKTGLLAAAGLALASLWFTRHLPSQRLTGAAGSAEAPAATPADV